MEASLALLLGHVAGKIGLALAVEISKAVSSRLGSQVSLLTGIHGQMNRIKSEFLVMQPFLAGFDTGSYNNTVEAWLTIMRNIARRAEDAIDEYTYLVAGEQSQHGFGSSISKAIKRTANVKAWLAIAARLKRIEDDLDHASKLKDRYDIKKLDSSQGICLNYVAQRKANPSRPSYVWNMDPVSALKDRHGIKKLDSGKGTGLRKANPSRPSYVWNMDPVSTLKDRHDIKKLDSGKGTGLRKANPSCPSYVWNMDPVSTLNDRHDIKKLDSGKGTGLNYIAQREANPSRPYVLNLDPDIY